MGEKDFKDYSRVQMEKGTKSDWIRKMGKSRKGVSKVGGQGIKIIDYLMY